MLFFIHFDFSLFRCTRAQNLQNSSNRSRSRTHHSSEFPNSHTYARGNSFLRRNNRGKKMCRYEEWKILKLLKKANQKEEKKTLYAHTGGTRWDVNNINVCRVLFSVYAVALNLIKCQTILLIKKKRKKKYTGAHRSIKFVRAL